MALPRVEKHLSSCEGHNSPQHPAQVSVVDWQWAGGGKVVRELPYFIWGALDPAVVDEATEAALLEHYRGELAAHGGEYAAAELQRDYALAFCDYVRHVAAYMWPNNAVAKGPEVTDGDWDKFMRLVHNKSSVAVCAMATAADKRLSALEEAWGLDDKA